MKSPILDGNYFNKQGFLHKFFKLRTQCILFKSGSGKADKALTGILKIKEMLADRDRNRHLWTYLDHSFVTLILATL